MPSPLFNVFGNIPMNNVSGLMQKFTQFKNTFSGNPKQQVQQLLNSGQMSQQQFNQLKQMADQMRTLLK